MPISRLPADAERRAERGPLLWLWALIAGLLLVGFLAALRPGWVLYLLLTDSAYMALVSARTGATFVSIAWSGAPAVGSLAAACLLICCRRDLGLKFAVAAIWLVPLTRLLQLVADYDALTSALAQRPPHQWIYPLLETGLFGAAGCTAFLLGTPQLRLLFPSGDTGGTGELKDVERAGPMNPPQPYREHSHWLAVLRVGYLLPLPVVIGLAIEATAGYRISASQVGYTFPPFQAEAVVGIVLAAAAALLTIWRRGASVALVVCLTWVLAVAPWLPMLFEWASRPLYHPITEADKLRFAVHFWLQIYGSVPYCYGFNFLAAIGWSAYLLSSPFIRARYPRRKDLRREREQLDVF